MPIAEAPTKTCSKCEAEGLSSPHCPNCGAPTYTPNVPSPAGSHAGQPTGNQPASPTPPVGTGMPTPAPSRKTPTWVKVLAIVGGLFLTMIVGCAALIGTAANEVDKELKEESSGDASDASEIKAKAGLNQPLSLKGTTYQVMSAKTAQSVGDQYTGAEANGTFVIIEVALTNQKDEPATITSDALRLVGGNGAAYTTSDDALLAVEDQFVLEEIQSGVTEQGTLIYDVPPAAVPGAVLQVEDLFSDDKGRVTLGL